ncbi:uncharacterized protein LOC131435234 [Malaya genurostris]|uniref:uncharacterized protein LOC131435234 n=1 Tax=Malaya genurostris TaxID=325434 RepID=UPI0026F3A0E3|nr:uncharacterized protein LOC131435234 [Malaya genurostris]
MASDLNWNSNITGIGPQLKMTPSQNKPMLLDRKCTANEKMSNKSSLGFVANIVQKMFNMLKPVEMPLTVLDRNKQSLSAPDIFVDMDINTPVFDTCRTRLTVPEDKESSDHMSLSVGNMPFDWYSVEKTGTNESCSWRFKKTTGAYQEVDWSLSKKKRPKTRRCFNRHSKSRIVGKNLNEKNRHNLSVDILEDYRQIPNDIELESEIEYCDSGMSENFKKERNLELTSINASNARYSLNLSEEFFPTIGFSVTNNSEMEIFDDKIRQASECDSENSFVIFSEDIYLTTPSASPKRRNDLCSAINNLFSTTSSRQREKHISECSDDSIVFCYDNKHSNADCHLNNSADTDNENDSSDKESIDEESDGDLSQPPDSGFEEKKVRFNLNPEVHEIRAWDFAYRHARKGEWEMAARDRERFKKRIEETEHILKHVFECTLRDRIYHERFSS